MSSKALVIPLMLALAACASAPDPAVSKAMAGPAPTTSAAEAPPVSPGAGPPPMKSSPSAAGWAVSIIGTPFAIAFKTVVCAASLVVAAPVAGFLAFGVDPSGEGYQALGDGIAQNCGPPYVVSPSAAS
jgi:hypothetical protein